MKSLENIIGTFIPFGVNLEAEGEEGRTYFFFEKKKQKTFVYKYEVSFHDSGACGCIEYLVERGMMMHVARQAMLPMVHRDVRASMACADNAAFMAGLPDGCMRLVVTSPPYNIGKTYEKRRPLDAYVEQQAACIAACVRLLDDRGSLCWQVGNHVQDGEIFPLDMVLYPVFQKHGLRLRNRIVWHFEHGLHCTKRLSGRYETILWFTKTDNYVFNLDPIRVPSKYPGKKYFKGPKVGQLSCNPLGKNPGDLWVFPNVKSNHVEKTAHPCQFPVELVERLVLALTEPGDGVFDPFMGVGSSVIAALKNDRAGYGCDTVQEYVDIAWSRVAELRAGVLQTRPMDKPVYDPAKPYGGHR